MNRREFLGTTLGLFTSLTATGKTINYIGAELFTKPIQQPLDTIKYFYTALRLSDGLAIQGPGVKRILDGSYILHDVNIVKTMTVTHLLTYYKGQHLFESKFHQGSIAVCNGDTLKITYTPTVDLGPAIIRPGDKDFETYMDKWFRKERGIDVNKSKHGLYVEDDPRDLKFDKLL
jgi:hypothetical protein